MNRNRIREHRTSNTLEKGRTGKRRKTKIRPVPILLAGFFINALLLCLATFFYGTIAYCFQLKIEQLTALAPVIYLSAVYLSTLLVSIIAGHRHLLLPLVNGFICLGISLIPLTIHNLSITENLWQKATLVMITSFAAYLTVKITSVSMAPKKKRSRVPIAERSRGIELR